jgi:hypothetical protein
MLDACPAGQRDDMPEPINIIGGVLLFLACIAGLLLGWKQWGPAVWAWEGITRAMEAVMSTLVFCLIEWPLRRMRRSR